MNAIKECIIENKSDENGNPTGGRVTGKGLLINWQDGPLGRHGTGCKLGTCSPDCTRKEPNGAFVETAISACLQRLEFYQKSKFNCAANQDAILALQSALDSLEARTRDRENRGVEGQHEE